MNRALFVLAALSVAACSALSSSGAGSSTTHRIAIPLARIEAQWTMDDGQLFELAGFHAKQLEGKPGPTLFVNDQVKVETTDSEVILSWEEE